MGCGRSRRCVSARRRGAAGSRRRAWRAPCRAAPDRAATPCARYRQSRLQPARPERRVRSARSRRRVAPPGRSSAARRRRCAPRSGQLARIEARIVAAWQQKIDPEGPPAAASAPTEPGAPAELAAIAIADTLRKAWQPDLGPLGTALAKLAAEILPRLDALQKRIDEIARTPLPPLTMASGLTAIAKRDDGNGGITSPEDIVAALARMSDEERTLTLIKATHANPIRPNGFGR